MFLSSGKARRSHKENKRRGGGSIMAVNIIK